MQIVSHIYDGILHACLEFDDRVIASDPPINRHGYSFNMSHYRKLSKDSDGTEWASVFCPANAFLRELSPVEIEALGDFYDNLWLFSRDENPIAAVTLAIARLLQVIDLPVRLQSFVERMIPIPDLSYVNTDKRADSYTMSFHREEYCHLLVISILAKLVCPIWGSHHAQLLREQHNSKTWETECLQMIKPLLYCEQLQPTYQKLLNYVDLLLMQQIQPKGITAVDDLVRYGYSMDKLQDKIVEMLIVKRYVNVDLYKSHGNILVWTSVCVKQAFASLIATLTRQHAA